MRSSAILLNGIIVSKVIAADLFPFETVQLQQSDLAALPAKYAPLLHFSTPSPSIEKCKVFPGDTAYPNDGIWAFLNSTTSHGGLIKTIPIAAPCYANSPYNVYNAEKCTFITNQWSNSSLHMEDPTSMMSPVFEGLTCLPPSLADFSTGQGVNCTIGGYPSYVINASDVRDVQVGVNFARNTGIRLVVKNTGHDFSGKSGGAGSLSIWTHHFKDIAFLPNFNDGAGYVGPAFKAGSGVQAWEIYEAASAKGMVVVGGEGRTVGVMGGYIQGGGHSPLSSIYGIAADHALSMEVVLASGEFVTASATQNNDLFWALRGGGGSTFGIVTSVIVKAHLDFPVTVTSFAFGGIDPITSYNATWAGIRAFFTHFIDFSSAGTYSYFLVVPSPVPIFEMAPFFAPNMTIAETQTLLKPWFDALAAVGITVAPKFNYYPNYLSAWEANFPQEAVGRDQGATGSRLFPRQNWEDPTLFNATFDAWKASIDAGCFAISFNFAPTLAAGGNSNNSVNPAFRNTVLHSIQSVGWAQNDTDATIKAQLNLLAERQAAWKAVSPGAGSYLGESDRAEVDFQQSFYGDFYPKLLQIKKQVDPGDVFWAKTAVGSEGWDTVTKDVMNDENGPLCRT